MFTSNGLEERYPDILIYGLPMLFDSQAEVDYVRQEMDATLAAGLEKAGFESYGFAGGGFAYFMTGKPVTGPRRPPRPEDLGPGGRPDQLSWPCRPCTCRRSYCPSPTS